MGNFVAVFLFNHLALRALLLEKEESFFVGGFAAVYFSGFLTFVRNDWRLVFVCRHLFLFD
mgnify:FL=1